MTDWELQLLKTYWFSVGYAIRLQKIREDMIKLIQALSELIKENVSCAVKNCSKLLKELKWTSWFQINN